MKNTFHDGAIATLGIDIGKNTFHLVGLDADCDARTRDLEIFRSWLLRQSRPQ